MNTTWKSRDTKQFIWPLAGIVIGALAGMNHFYQPNITVEIGIAAWFADMALVLILTTHPIAARVGVLVAGLFLAVPCFLCASPLTRGLLMGCMVLPLVIAVVPLLAPTADFRARFAFLYTWGGTREVKRRARSFDMASLLHFIVATVILAGAVVSVKTIPVTGFWLLVRWFGGGIFAFAFAEMVTASHNFLTALLGLTAPALMQSPHLSTSLSEFWSERWNPGASVVYRIFWFMPLARYNAGLALVAAFLASALFHVLLFYMAIVQWKISLICGAFFLVQPLFIAVERWMKVRCWRPAAGWAWTLAVLAITSPLIVEPALEIIEPSWGAPNQVLGPTIVMLGFVIILNGIYSLGQFAFLPELMPLTALKPKATAL